MRDLESLAGGARPKRRKGSVAGAKRLVVAALRAMDAPTEASQLRGKGKWVDETALVVRLAPARRGKLLQSEFSPTKAKNASV